MCGAEVPTHLSIYPDGECHNGESENDQNGAHPATGWA
jgi:hypothetical protein